MVLMVVSFPPVTSAARTSAKCRAKVDSTIIWYVSTRPKPGRGGCVDSNIANSCENGCKDLEWMGWLVGY